MHEEYGKYKDEQQQQPSEKQMDQQLQTDFANQDEYYLLIEAADREQYLKQESEKIVGPEIHAYREELFDLRYDIKNSKGNKEYIDHFMQIWIELNFHSRETLTDRKNKKALRQISGIIEKNGLLSFREKDELARSVLYQEMRHLVRVYIWSASTDRSYTRFFSLVPYTKNRLHAKINNDVAFTMVEYPEIIGLDQVLPELVKAAKDELEYFNSRVEQREKSKFYS